MDSWSILQEGAYTFQKSKHVSISRTESGPVFSSTWYCVTSGLCLEGISRSWHRVQRMEEVQISKYQGILLKDCKHRIDAFPAIKRPRVSFPQEHWVRLSCRGPAGKRSWLLRCEPWLISLTGFHSLWSRYIFPMMHQILIFHTLVGIILEIRKVPLKVHSKKPSSLSMNTSKTSSGRFGLFSLVTGYV